MFLFKYFFYKKALNVLILIACSIFSLNNFVSLYNFTTKEIITTLKNSFSSYDDVLVCLEYDKKEENIFIIFCFSEKIKKYYLYSKEITQSNSEIEFVNSINIFNDRKNNTKFILTGQIDSIAVYNFDDLNEFYVYKEEEIGLKSKFS